MKKCTGCGVLKNPEDFSKHSGFKDGRNSRCKECKRIKANLMYANGEIKKRPYTYRSQLWKYRLSIEEYNKLFDLHNGACHICKLEKKLNVDHDHTTGKVRGLLCVSCNTGIGKLGDNYDSIHRVLKYLE